MDDETSAKAKRRSHWRSKIIGLLLVPGGCPVLTVGRLLVNQRVASGMIHLAAVQICEQGSFSSPFPDGSAYALYYNWAPEAGGGELKDAMLGKQYDVVLAGASSAI